jgi:hypothetical protein
MKTITNTKEDKKNYTKNLRENSQTNQPIHHKAEKRQN